MYILNAKPRAVATALIEPVTIPTIEPVDNLEEEVDTEFDWAVFVGEFEFEFEFKLESGLVAVVGEAYPGGYCVPVEIPFEPV